MGGNGGSIWNGLTWGGWLLIDTCRNRKGRLGAEIKEMRSRLVDLGLSYARQQSVARRGVGAPDSGNAGLAPMPESKVEEGGEKLKDLSIQVHKARVGEFCVGLDEAQGNIVAKAVDELQGSGNPSPFSPRASRTSGGSAHLERSRNSLERSRSIGRAAKGSAGKRSLSDVCLRSQDQNPCWLISAYIFTCSILSPSYRV